MRRPHGRVHRCAPRDLVRGHRRVASAETLNVRWSNVPIPETHVAALVGAAGLHAVLPVHLPIAWGQSWPLGGPMLAAGIGLAAWAVASAGETDIAGDDTLVTRCAYAVSRNPMYLGWSVGVLGLAMGTRSAWLLEAW